MIIRKKGTNHLISLWETKQKPHIPLSMRYLSRYRKKAVMPRVTILALLLNSSAGDDVAFSYATASGSNTTLYPLAAIWIGCARSFATSISNGVKRLFRM